MNDLVRLAALIRRRNALNREIALLVGRPALMGHVGEYIASKVFGIVLEESASHKSIDGQFGDGPLKGYTVNIKWYARREGVLDITPDALPDYYLVLTGPKSAAQSSNGKMRPWLIENAYLFDAQNLADELRRRGAKMGVATSVRQQLWAQAEIYPTLVNPIYPLTQEQRELLALFGSSSGG